MQLNINTFNNLEPQLEEEIPTTPRQPIILTEPVTPARTARTQTGTVNNNRNPNPNRIDLTNILLMRFRNVYRYRQRLLFHFSIRKDGCKQEEYLTNRRNDKDDDRSFSCPVPTF